MFKFLTCTALLLAGLFAPIQVNAAETVEEPGIVEEEEPFEQFAYLIYEEDGEYIFVGLSETDLYIQYTDLNGNMTGTNAKYTIIGNVLTVYVEGNVWNQYLIKDDELEHYDPAGVIPPGDTEIDDSVIDKFFNREEWSNLIGAVLAYLVANLGTIIFIIISFIKNKIKAIDKDTLFKELTMAKDEVEIKLRKEYEAKFEQYQKDIVGYLQSLENKVIGKLDTQELERKEEIRKQSLELEATIQAVNKKASIDEILNK